MKHKSRNRYKKLKDGILIGASSSLVAGMLIMGYTTPALAETGSVGQSSEWSVTGMHVMRKWNSRPKINALVNTLGLDHEYVMEELKSGKNLKQILQDNGINPQSLDKAFNGKQRHKSWKKHNM